MRSIDVIWAMRGQASQCFSLYERGPTTGRQAWAVYVPTSGYATCNPYNFCKPAFGRDGTFLANSYRNRYDAALKSARAIRYFMHLLYSLIICARSPLSPACAAPLRPKRSARLPSRGGKRDMCMELKPAWDRPK